MNKPTDFVIMDDRLILYGHRLLKRKEVEGNMALVVNVPMQTFLAYVQVRFWDRCDVQRQVEEEDYEAISDCVDLTLEDALNIKIRFEKGLESDSL